MVDKLYRKNGLYLFNITLDNNCNADYERYGYQIILISCSFKKL